MNRALARAPRETIFALACDSATSEKRRGKILSPNGPPPPHRLIDELLYFADLRRDVLGTVGQRFATYGDVYYSRVRGQGFFSAMDPAFVHEVLVTEAASFRRRTIDLEFLGNGVLTSQGDEWRSKRRRVQPGFRNERVRGYARFVCDDVERLLGGLRSGDRLDLQASMRELTLRVVCRALFGQEFSGSAERLGDATRYLQEAVLVPKLLPAWLPTPGKLWHQRMSRVVDREVYAIIDREGEDEGSLLAALRQSVDSEPAASRRELRDEVVTLLLAGHETTALALTWAFHLLALHPGVQERVAQEAREAAAGGALGASHVDRLELARNVLAETLRLYPPVYVLPRVCTRAVTVGGFRVSPGDELWLWPYFMHRDARWFSMPERFEPERFVRDGQSIRNSHAYLPFGAGARSCVGQGFATLEAVLVIALVLSRFRLEPSDARPVFARPRITLAPARRLRVTLHAR